MSHQESMLAHNSSKDDAKAQLKKLQRAEDGKKAMSEYEAEGVAMRAKTARLRALRLARDEAAAKAAPAPVTKAPAKKRSAKKTASTAKLADWLDDQRKDGR
jgi:hypothetical protein